MPNLAAFVTFGRRLQHQYPNAAQVRLQYEFFAPPLQGYTHMLAQFEVRRVHVQEVDPRRFHAQYQAPAR